MLRLWFTALPEELAPAASDLVQAGVFVPAGRAVPGGNMPILREVRTAAEIVAAPASAYYLPGGLSADLELADSLRATGREALIAVNGLSDSAVAQLCSHMQGSAWSLAFDARGLGIDALMEQLAWFRGQGRAPAVLMNADQPLSLVMLANPHSIILVNDGQDVALGPALRVLTAQRPGAARPHGSAEADALDGAELCLTVKRPMEPGEIVDEAALDVAVTATRGLSPMLRARVAGCRLRYAVMPGEALHFGHLEGPQ